MLIKFTKTIVLTCAVALLAGICSAQSLSFPKPRNETLLNDLNLLIWRQSAAKKISVTLRIHSGSAFDPVGKEGAAKLLTDVMFPDSGIYEDFADDLGGSLKVSSTYDYLQIDMTATPDKLVEVLDILAGAVVNTQIDKDTAAEAKKYRLGVIEADSENLAAIADMEIAERLYDSFPYGRPADGSVESLQEIDFADIIFAKQRFVTADNATLSITGNISTSFAYRAARRLMGGWKKGNGRIPANFTVPEKPDTAPLVVNTDFGVSVEKRLAVEAVSRSHSDYYTAKILARALDQRLKGKDGGSLHFQSYFLRGYYTLSQVLPREFDILPPPPPTAEGAGDSNTLFALLSVPIEAAEFEAAKSAEVQEFKGYDVVQHWLDVDTYQLKSVEDEFKKLQSVSLDNVNGLRKTIAANPIVNVSLIPLEPSKAVNTGDPDDPR